MDKQNVYKAELAKMLELFADVDPKNIKLVEGLIEDAAFLFAENYRLKQTLNETGMVKIHPNNPTIQRSLPAAKEYRQNLSSYAVIIKTLNNILQKNISDGDDEFDEYMNEMRDKKDDI